MGYIEMEIRHTGSEILGGREKHFSPLIWKCRVFGHVHSFYKETTSALGVRGMLPPAFFSMLGVGQFFLCTEHDLDPLFNLSEQLMPHMPQKWKFLQTADVMVILTSFFEKCSIVYLSDLNRLDNSIELWRGIIQHILRPMSRTDLRFIINSDQMLHCYSAGRVGQLFEEIRGCATLLWTKYSCSTGQFAEWKANQLVE